MDVPNVYVHASMLWCCSSRCIWLFANLQRPLTVWDLLLQFQWQMCRDKECFFSDVTNYGRVWRKGAKIWGLGCGFCTIWALELNCFDICSNTCHFRFHTAASWRYGRGSDGDRKHNPRPPVSPHDHKEATGNVGWFWGYLRSLFTWVWLHI